TRTSAAIKLNEGDRVLLTELLGENMQLALQSEEGYFLRFGADEIPEKKKAAVGVRAMKLSDTDSLTGAWLFAKGTEQVITYKEKEIALQKLKLSGRDQKGTKIRV
ncbi:MAG: DNA topoisomerase, partial [Lachnospiraceae bacterium]|nr:DNA topoisomerase [Lachnospiraceae bacterium]